MQHRLLFNTYQFNHIIVHYW